MKFKIIKYINNIFSKMLIILLEKIMKFLTHYIKEEFNRAMRNIINYLITILTKYNFLNIFQMY